MSAWSYRCSNPDRWTSPRAFSDASLRYRAHGPIQPMDTERRGLFQRLFGID